MNGEQVMIEYARLLRRAWLNPQHKPWQIELHEFEHEYQLYLLPFWESWQRNP